MVTGEYNEILRVIGRLLDERETLASSELGAHSGEASRWLAEHCQTYEGVEIVEHESFVRVSWRARDGSGARRAFTDLTLSLLHSQALQLRGEATFGPSGEREELLRTLGQELDAAGLNVSGIVEQGDQFFVSGSAAGCYFNRAYSHEELRALSGFRKQLRPGGEPRQQARDLELHSPVGWKAHWLVWGH